ncbi:ASCH domain-containing protein [Leptospira bouyouniensis]|uniref:ASCH domain-containing protein n=1 Tax=Leptospira bouyouniensis TaxID=2484911 RepID=A0ABY2L274_9LEPT|nr:ASCH domain-containing protein [Leptospira bouyouniensis]TGK45552.1 ASCH domain-containing protein [Leptospira bouyouniensis]
MILGFNKQFVSKILSGEKIHTIRRDDKDRWKPGKIIHFSTGVRTKNYNQFAIGRCTYTLEIIINPAKERVFISKGSGLVYRGQGVLAFAKNDGFDSLDDFWKWFNQPFEGKLIHWDLFANGRSEI